MRTRPALRRRTRVAWRMVVALAAALLLTETTFALDLKVVLYSDSGDAFRVVATRVPERPGVNPVQDQVERPAGGGFRTARLTLDPGRWRVSAERSPAGQWRWRSWGGRELQVFAAAEHTDRTAEMALDYFPRRRSIVPLLVGMYFLFGLLAALAVRADVRQAKSEGQRRVNPPPEKPWRWIAKSFLCFPLVIRYSAIYAQIRDAVPRHPPLTPLEKTLRTPPIVQGVLACLWAPVAGLAIAWAISPLSLAGLKPVIGIAALVVLSASIILVQRTYERTVPQTRRTRPG